VFCAACGSRNPYARAFCFNCSKALAGFLNESKTNLFVPIGVAADGHTASPTSPTPKPQLPDPEVERILREYPALAGVGVQSPDRLIEF
jgi:hypothetical protein